VVRLKKDRERVYVSEREKKIDVMSFSSTKDASEEGTIA
jgi:hypothetical protein